MLLGLNMSLLITLNWWVTNGILLDNSTDSSFFLLTPLDDTPYRRMDMSYQVEELVVTALAHVVGSGITVNCGIMYVPNGWWKCQDTYREIFQSIVDNCHASNLQFNVQTLKLQSFVQLQLYLVATSTTRAVSIT
jgi:hypothetical protein